MDRPDRTADLGTVTAGPDGHFETYGTLPEDYPTGAAELVALGDDGSEASLDLVIGEKRVIENNARAPWWQDPSVLLLAGIVGGTVLFVGWALVRGQPRQSQPTGAAPRGSAPRKRVARKARRT
jgi:hypothetical protein